MLKNEQILDYATTLNTVNYEIAELTRIKEELEKKLAVLLEHAEEGSKTYTHDKYKITLTTGFIYCLDKDEYEVMRTHIPECFNPVRQKISYEIDKKIIKDAEKYANEYELNLLSRLISKKPKKLHCAIKAGV